MHMKRKRRKSFKMCVKLHNCITPNPPPTKYPNATLLFKFHSQLPESGSKFRSLSCPNLTLQNVSLMTRYRFFSKIIQNGTVSNEMESEFLIESLFSFFCFRFDSVSLDKAAKAEKIAAVESRLAGELESINQPTEQCQSQTQQFKSVTRRDRPADQRDFHNFVGHSRAED